MNAHKYGYLSVILVLAFLLAGLPAHNARAGDEYLCYVDDSATGANDGVSWMNAYTDLQSALANASCSEIWVAAGTYKPTTGTNRTVSFVLRNGLGIYGGFAGIETKRGDRNPAVNVTILSGDLNGDDVGFTYNSENTYHVVMVTAGGTATILDGFTIRGGNATAYLDPTHAYGGGIFLSGSSPTLANNTITGNVSNYGGGMYIGNGSNPTLMNVTFSGNLAGGGFGGGVFNNNGSNPTFTNVTFSGNSAGSFGGGMYNTNNSNPTLVNVTLTGNSAVGGGGIDGGIPTVRNSILWGNTSGGNANVAGAQFYESAPVIFDSVVQNGCPEGGTCTNLIVADPKLGLLGDHGGFTQTVPILPGSSAIDTGDDVTCASTDQRGIIRPLGAHCDIGAYEYQSPLNQCPISMVSYWKNDGTAEDLVGTNDGAITNPNWSADCINGSCMQSDPLGSTYISVPNSPSLNSVTDQVTVEAWVYPSASSYLDGQGNCAWVAMKESTPGGNFQYGLCVGGNWAGEAEFHTTTQNGWAVVRSTYDLPAREWYHLVGVYDGSNLHLYINGVENRVAPQSGSLVSGTQPFWMGRYCGGLDWCYSGKVDEVAVYSQALTPAEIQQHYQNGLAGESYCEPGSFIPPPFPSSFYGEIHISDAPLVDGDTVEAYVPGITTAAATVTIATYESKLIYNMDIPGDLLDTTATKEGGAEGDVVTFKIGGRIVATSEWHSGTHVELTLHPPEALPGGPYFAGEGETIQFTGSANDWGNDTALYQWDWDNDGTYDESGPTPAHIWNQFGNYTVDLKVTDARHGEGVTTFTVTVNDVPPTNVSAGGPYSAISGQPVTLTGSATCASVDTCIYEWDLDGDGQYDDATGTSITNTWHAIDDYIVSLRVTDSDNNSVTVTADVHIAPLTHSVTLVPGWNLVSFNVHPTNTTIAAVLSSISSKYDLIYAWDATGAHSSSGNWLKADNVSASPDSLTDLNEAMGFWIHMNSAGTLNVTGSMPTTSGISIWDNAGGWNLVGYPTTVNGTLPEVLNDLG